MNKEVTKERLAEYRFWRGAVVAAIVGIVGWFVTNYEKANNTILCAIVGCFIISLVILAMVSIGINNRIEELRD